MGKEVVYCDVCGERLLEEQFTSGNAITVQNKNYCANCREEALKNLPPPLKTDPPAAKKSKLSGVQPSVSSPGPHRAQPHVGKSSTRHYVPPPRSSITPILIGAVVGAVALILLVILILQGGGETAAPPGENPNPPPETGRLERARTALAECRAHWKQNPTDPEGALKFLESKKPDAAGTPMTRDFESLEAEIRLELDSRRTGDQLRKKLEEIAQAMKGDPEFEAFSRIRNELDTARSQALKQRQEHLLAEIRKLEEPYVSAYEEKAREEYEKIYAVAANLASAAKYRDALQMIDSYPPKFRLSTSWKRLEDLKREYQGKLENP